MRVFIFFLLLFSLQNTVRADTIDYWHVYYNKVKVKEYNVNTTGTIVLKVRNIKRNDSLIIKYFRDTPCYNCETQAIVKNTRKVIAARGKGKGTFNPISVSLFDLLQHHIKTKESHYKIFYKEGKIKKEDQQRPIFKIKLE